MLADDFPDVLARIRAGDEEAFARLFRDVQPLLLRYLRVCAPGHGEDVAADTWIAVTKGLGAFTGDEAGLRAWIFTIARHRAVDVTRWHARRPTVSAVGQLGDEATVADPADQLEESESTAEAIRLIRTLPPDQAEVVMLRVVAGLKNVEIAALLHKTPGAVRVLSHRGLRRLAQDLRSSTTNGCNAWLPTTASHT